MSLDERLRDELRRSVEDGGLHEDDALDAVWLTHRRALVRKGVIRQTTAATVVLSLFAGVAVFVSWRNVPDRYRSTATVRVATAAGSTTVTHPLQLADPKKLALAASTRRAALQAAHRSPDDAKVDFRATLNPSRDLLSLAATAPSANESTVVTQKWVSELATVRRADARWALRASYVALAHRVNALRKRLTVVDTELAKLDPATYGGILFHDLAGPISEGLGSRRRTPPAPSASASVHELNLLNERIRLLEQLAADSASAAGTRISPPIPFASQLITQTPAVRVDQTVAATAPALVGWAIGLVLVLAGALLAYRRRTRSMRQVSEYSR